MRRLAEDCLLSIWGRRGPLSTALLPLSWIYGTISRHRLHAQARHAWRAPVPVIVIGNILVGGTGKTPVTAAVCEALQEAGWHPGLVSRGYGVRIDAQPHLSDASPRSDWLADEPALLHAATGAPVAVHPLRALAGQALLAAHPEIDVLIADDALQHRALARDLEIIVQDARGIGNGRLLPAGPLREPAERLFQAQWVVTQLGHGERAPNAAAIGRARAVTMRLTPRLAVQLATGRRLSWADWHDDFGSAPCSAIAGIGRPERFFAMLQACGVRLARTHRLRDHGNITAAMLAALPAGPVLITPKDAVKLAACDDARVWVVHADPVFSDPSWMQALLAALRTLSPDSAHEPATGIKL